MEIPPLVAGATTFPPRWEACHWIRGSRGSLRIQFPCHRKRGHYKAPLCCELLMKGLLFRALFCPRLRGKSGAAGKEEASAASQSAECLSCHMTLEVNPVTLTLYSSPVRAIPQPSARRAVKLKNPPALRPVNPKNLFLHNPSTQPAALAAPLFIKLAAKPPPPPLNPLNLLNLHARKGVSKGRVKKFQKNS